MRTGFDGEAVELARVAVTMRVDRQRGVLDVEADPAEPRLDQLVDDNPYVGWRRRIDELLPDHRDASTLLYLVLDALPGWMNLSAFGLTHMPRIEGSPWRQAPPPGHPFDAESRRDLCAGWQAGGTLLQLMSGGNLGADFLRPPAPPLERADDPLAWHPSEALPPFGSRRRRRVDVVAGVPLSVDAMFRDSSIDAEGVEGVLHEYTVTAAIDPETLQVVGSEAVPRSLPYLECPEAAVSAGQLIGQDVRGLRRFVSQQMRGPTTCTHLNELYRTFGDIPALARQL
jgi:hypothetical protein